jgi:hypothetical protein
MCPISFHHGHPMVRVNLGYQDRKLKSQGKPDEQPDPRKKYWKGKGLKKTVSPSRTHFLTAHDQRKKNSSDLWSDSALNILQTCQDATDAFDTTWRRSCARIAPFWRDMPPARPWGPVDELMGGGALVSWCITVLALPQAILKRYNLQVYLYITLYSAFQLNIYLCVCKYIYICVCVEKLKKRAFDLPYWH